MKPSSIPMRFTVSLLLSALATLACISFVDGCVAHKIWGFTSSLPALHARLKNIPNTLPALVVVGTALLLLCIAYLPRTGRLNAHSGFIRLAAITLPAAYLLKTFLQKAFGRTNTRLWLKSGGPIEFRWFNPVENGGFPSGHTLVITSLLTAVWLYYPRLRPVCVVLFAALAAALLATSSHFLSDILAGGLFGALLAIGLNRILSRRRTDGNRSNLPLTS